MREPPTGGHRETYVAETHRAGRIRDFRQTRGCLRRVALSPVRVAVSNLLPAAWVKQSSSFTLPLESRDEGTALRRAIDLRAASEFLFDRPSNQYRPSVGRLGPLALCERQKCFHFSAKSGASVGCSPRSGYRSCGRSCRQTIGCSFPSGRRLFSSSGLVPPPPSGSAANASPATVARPRRTLRQSAWRWPSA